MNSARIVSMQMFRYWDKLMTGSPSFRYQYVGSRNECLVVLISFTMELKVTMQWEEMINFTLEKMNIVQCKRLIDVWMIYFILMLFILETMANDPYSYNVDNGNSFVSHNNADTVNPFMSHNNTCIMYSDNVLFNKTAISSALHNSTTPVLYYPDVDDNPQRYPECTSEMLNANVSVIRLIRNISEEWIGFADPANQLMLNILRHWKPICSSDGEKGSTSTMDIVCPALTVLGNAHTRLVNAIYNTTKPDRSELEVDNLNSISRWMHDNSRRNLTEDWQKLVNATYNTGTGGTTGLLGRLNMTWQTSIFSRVHRIEVGQRLNPHISRGVSLFKAVGKHVWAPVDFTMNRISQSSGQLYDIFSRYRKEMANELGRIAPIVGEFIRHHRRIKFQDPKRKLSVFQQVHFIFIQLNNRDWRRSQTHHEHFHNSTFIHESHPLYNGSQRIHRFTSMIYRWTGLTDPNRNVSLTNLKDLYNLAGVTVSQIFKLNNVYNSTGCITWDILPLSNDLCIWPRFVATEEAAVYQSGFDIWNPQCPIDPIHQTQFVVYTTSHLVGFDTYIDERPLWKTYAPFINNVVYNSQSTNHTLPPNMIPCVIWNPFAYTLLFLEGLAAFLLIAIFGKVAVGINQRTNPRNQNFFEQSEAIKGLFNDPNSPGAGFNATLFGLDRNNGMQRLPV